MKSRILSLLLMVGMFLFFLEGATCVLVKAGVLLHEAPTYSWKNVSSQFWVEMDPVFGVWHSPNSQYLHRRACFSVEYQANSFGMRDPERKKLGSEHRAVVLGDSFVEGFGIAQGKRFTDLLEKHSGKEYLNFGTSGHFGPTQYYLLYKTLAAQFSHDEIIIGLYPKNDFTDDDLVVWKDSGKYRPFWVGSYPNYEMVYSAEHPKGLPGGFGNSFKAVLREYTYSFNLFEYLKGLLQFKLKELASKKSKDALGFSAYHDFSEEQWNRMRFSLEKIRELAGNKPITLLLFPSPSDVLRNQGAKIPPLTQRLQTWAQGQNIQVVDVLPFILKEGENWQAMYNFPCDKHFSEQGHAKVAEAVEQSLK